jgi:hypothetical protein
MSRSPSPAAPYIPSNPPRELKTKEVRQGLGAAVLGGEPASLRAGEGVRDVGRNRFELGSIESPVLFCDIVLAMRA